jgi:hypothetical protein
MSCDIQGLEKLKVPTTGNGKKRRAVSKAYQKHGFHPKRSCDFVDHVQTNSGGVVAGLLLVVGQKHDSQSGTNHSTSLVP